MLLQLVTDNRALTADAHRFGSAADRERIDAELRSWWNGPSEAQTPVLLAWAAFTALANLGSKGAQIPTLQSTYASLDADDGAVTYTAHDH